MNRLCLDNNRLEFQTSDKLRIILEEAMNYTSQRWASMIGENRQLVAHEPVEFEK